METDSIGTGRAIGTRQADSRLLNPKGRFDTFYDYLVADGQEILANVDGMLRNLPFQPSSNNRTATHQSQERTAGEEKQFIRDWRIHLKKLLHEDTKRIQMDSRQASTFDLMNVIPPEMWQRKLHSPFPEFYMEFDEPIVVGEQEPGYHDYLRAILFWEDAGTIHKNPEIESESYKFIEQIFPAGLKVSFANITFFLDNGARQGTDEYELIDRSFLYLLNQGLALTALRNTQDTDDPSEVAEGYPPGAVMIAGDPMDISNRYMGWWERTIIDYGSLLSWLMVYMMAKGIEIAVAPRTRAQRRREERKAFPKPWHVVRVEPKLVQEGQPAEEPGTRHSYRYDVMGHLRFGRHKLAGGDYRDTIEWVNPHQRGLANELYIPKTSKFVSGKETHPIMDTYFPKEENTQDGG